MAPIKIRDNELDPAKPGTIKLPDGTKTKYILIQLKSDLTADTLKILQGQNAKPVKKMTDTNWLCVQQPSDLKRFVGLAPIQAALVYLPFFKLQASLKTPLTTSKSDRCLILVASS